MEGCGNVLGFLNLSLVPSVLLHVAFRVGAVWEEMNEHGSVLTQAVSIFTSVSSLPTLYSLRSCDGAPLNLHNVACQRTAFNAIMSDKRVNVSSDFPV